MEKVIKTILKTMFIGLFMLNFDTQAQTKEEVLEFTGGLIAESVILIPAIGRDVVDIKHYSYGTAAALTGVIITGKYILKKDGSISTAIIGAIVGGTAGFIIKDFILGQAIIGNDLIVLSGLTWLFIMPPLGATVGYSHKEDSSSALLNFYNGRLSIKMPTIGLKIIRETNSTVFQVDIIKFTFW